MRKLTVFISFFLLLSVTDAFSAAGKSPQKSGRGTEVREFVLGKNKKKIVIVNAGENNPRRLVWLFSGYRPKGDPYKQSPSVFIKKWDLEKTALKNKWVFVIPDMGTSLYARNGKVSDLDWLHNAYVELAEKYPAKPYFIGVSTGVEGAVKLTALLEPSVPVIALSGTYDLFHLPADSGEYRLHRKTLGVKPSVWTNENPMYAFLDGRRYTVYLFCEEKSVYYEQALILGSAGFRNVEIINHLGLGKGKGHNWDFWGDPEVVKTVMGIIGK